MLACKGQVGYLFFFGANVMWKFLYLVFFVKGRIVEWRTRSLGQEDPLEEDMETLSSISWEISWTEEPVSFQRL